MTPDSHEFTAKNGRIIMIRGAKVEDARAMVDYLKKNGRGKRQPDENARGGRHHRS